MSDAGHQGQASVYSDDLRDAYPVFLRIGYGNQLYVGAMGKGSGQRGNLQNDFTSIQYPNWRDDWIPEWYQTEPERRR
jgi:hypothetical protein